ncbi:hypothetical protein G9A89_005525 [Geosiphon pyriformis]|nr:hypothetical protein G9A89_005525 [Geosiphon pyriformis]
MVGDFDWVCTALVWHPNLHMAAGFTSKSTSVAMWKYLYNRDYPSVLCLHCREVKSSDHFFVCTFDFGVHKNLLASHLAKWHAMSCLGLSLFQIS